MEPNVDVVVVGAGFAGIYALYKFREQGFSVRGFEAGADLGGTWYFNRYPGARCDVESMDYSYSFSDELQQEWRWTERYPAQPEILAYLNHVADRFDLRRDLRLSTRVTAARFDEDRRRWAVTTDDGETTTARHVVMATGALSVRKDLTTEFPGLDGFRGEWHESAAWPHEPVDFAGKRVVLIGTGASGLQLTPTIAREAGHLTVLQRTAAYSLPTRNGPLDPAVEKSIKSRYPQYRAEARQAPFGIPVELPTRSALEFSPEEARADLEERWQAGGNAAMMTAFTDILTDERANEVVADFIRDKIRETVRDPATAELLCPTTYPFGTKRPCMDIGYYETFNRDDVSLVSISDNPVEEVTPTGLRLADGTAIEADVIVFATGFDAITGAVLNIDITGRDGRSLRRAWADGPSAYLGLFVSDFPNLLLIGGPGSPSLLGNAPLSFEQNVDWLAGLLVTMREHGQELVEADPEAQTKWMDLVAQIGEATLFNRADSWYRGANVPGKPRGLMLYVAGFGAYRAQCDQIATEGYPGLVLSGRPALAG